MASRLRREAPGEGNDLDTAVAFRSVRASSTVDAVKKLSLGIDIDGVVYDFWNAFNPWLINAGVMHKPVAPTRWNWWESYGLREKHAVALLCEAVKQGALFWNGPPIAGAIEGLAYLREAGHNVTLVTDRRLRDIELVARQATYYWLVANHVPHDNLIIGTKRGLNFDIMLDDKPQTIKELTDDGDRAVFFDQPWNNAFPDERVKSWVEFTELVDRAAYGKFS